MTRRAAATQVDIARVIRAARRAGLPVARVIVDGARIVIETTDAPDAPAKPVAQRRELVL